MTRHGDKGRALLALVALVCVACEEPARAPEPAPPAATAIDHAVVDTQVRALFAAIDRGDCDVLAPQLSDMHTRDECTELVRSSHEEHLRLVDITEVTTDGRDPRSAIVRSTLERNGRARQVLIRATLTPEGRWTFAM